MVIDPDVIKYLILSGLCLLVFLVYRPHRVRKAKFFDELRAQYGAKVSMFYARFRFKGYSFTVSAPAMSPTQSSVKILVNSPRRLIGSVAFYPKVFGQITISTSFWGLNKATTVEIEGIEFRARTDNPETIQRLQSKKEIWDRIPGLILQSQAGMIMVDARRNRLTLEGLDLEWVMHSPETYFMLCCQILEALDMSTVATEGLVATQPENSLRVQTWIC